ncbi:MAG: hypothetical protein J6X44_13660, partial [Thermoguttaceae bacterium]|nr:hypothetical protein [Thermoguttaceae bacterium]
MRNRNRLFLALGVAFALCVPYAASLVNGAFFNVNAPYAQDEDPFGDDAFDEDVDSEDPFGESNASDPFAPSTISGGSEASKPSVAAPAKTDLAPEQAEGEATDERSKYLRPEDVPDELKTEEDFFATASASEKAVLGRNPQNSAELFSAAAQIARVG